MNIKNASILTGVSDQMIRYYEKLGLIHPQRNKNNNYRDYQQADINNIVMIKQYSELGLSLKNLALLIKNNNMQDALDAINKTLNELEIEAQWIKARIDNTTHYQNLLKMIIENTPSTTGIYPTSYFYPRHDDNTQDLYTSLYHSAGAAKTVFHIPHELINLDNYPINQGMHTTKKLDDEKLEVITIPAHRYWLTLRIVDNNHIINKHELMPILKQMNDEGYELKGDILLYQIACKDNKKGLIYICIECDIGPIV